MRGKSLVEQGGPQLSSKGVRTPIFIHGQRVDCLGFVSSGLGDESAFAAAITGGVVFICQLKLAP